jgi:hypothetical protein
MSYRWWTPALGALLVLCPVAIMIASSGPVLASHPAYLITLVVVEIIGLVMISRWWWRRPGRQRPGWLRWLGRGVQAVAVLLTVGVLVWLVPLPAAPNALAALSGTGTVRVQEHPTYLTVAPTTAATTGLVLYPGALVEPRAYLPLATRLAEQGYLVEIVKLPYGIAFAAPNAPTAARARHPEIEHWAVGGHSLGGTVAASFAAAHTDWVDGLLLWASYPVSSIADSGLAVASVSAGNDGLATPADIDASRPDLPADAVFTEVPGAVHAYFGDYGPQSGDGVATVPRDQAQDEIMAASAALLARLA